MAKTDSVFSTPPTNTTISQSTDGTTSRRRFLSNAAGIAAGATALALAAVPGLALPIDPVFAAIDAHRVAATAYEVAEREYDEALSDVHQRATEIMGKTATAWWMLVPNDLGFYAEFGDHIDVSAQPVPHGKTKKTYTGFRTHEDIDALADAGVMYRGERERLHAALDGNLSLKDAIVQLSIAGADALEAERRAMRDLIDVKPTTMAGALALADYLGAAIG
jgi:hypothetical protein